MKYALHIGKEPNFQAVVIVSAAIHLILVALIVVPLRAKGDEYRSYFVDLVGPLETMRDTNNFPDKKGDLVSPSLKKEDSGRVSSKDVAMPESKTDMSLEPAERVSKEIERIRSISALSKLKDKKEEEKTRNIEIIRQNIHGSAVRGAGRTTGAQASASDSYYALIQRKVRSEWVYPDFSSSELEVIISIKIDRDGRITSYEIEKTSGNALFDRSAVKAVSKASPLPQPPYEMEIGMRFYL